MGSSVLGERAFVYYVDEATLRRELTAQSRRC
jgi:hypothetical protein